MQDLTYIISIGFSGSDLPRAIMLAFFCRHVRFEEAAHGCHGNLGTAH